MFDCLENAPFDTTAYSKMKFGCGQSAKKIGREMADAFAAENWDMLTREKILVIPAPSTTVLVAASLMAVHFADRLNSLLDAAGHAPVERDMIHRAVTYNDDYATRSVEERRKLLADDARYMNVAFAAGKTLVFVDDVRITGTHEHKLSDMMAELVLENPVVFATYAAYSGEDPTIEDRLNKVWMNDFHGLTVLMMDEEWTVTTRALRLALEQSAEDFARILHRSDDWRLLEIYHAAIVKGYSQHKPYEANFEALRKYVGE